MASNAERTSLSHPRTGMLAATPSQTRVGVSWYEANAYCKWLKRHWKELEESRSNNLWSPAQIRLPTEMEWVKLAGGDQPGDRYPWDKPGEATTDLQEILKRANIA